MTEEQPDSGPQPKKVGWSLVWFGFVQGLLGVVLCPTTNPPSPCWPYAEVFVVTAILGSFILSATSRSKPDAAKFRWMHACMLAGYFSMLGGPLIHISSGAPDNARTFERYRRVTHGLLYAGAGIAACSAIGIYLLDRKRN